MHRRQLAVTVAARADAAGRSEGGKARRMGTEADRRRGGRPLKVLELGTQFGVGGITRHIRLLSDWLGARGHEVTLGGTPDVWGGPDGDEGFLVLPTRYVAADGGNPAARLRHLAAAAWRLRRWLKRHRPDLIHAHESAPALVADLARRGLGIPLAVTYHGSEPARVAAFARIARRADLVCDLLISCRAEALPEH